MAGLLRWGKRIDDRELAELETLLQAALLPVPPRRNYKHDLHRRLSNAPALEVEFPKVRWPLYLWLVLVGMVAGLVVAIWGIKTVIALGGLSALLNIKRRAQDGVSSTRSMY